MPSALLPIVHLLLAVAFLEIGGGLQGVLVPIRAQMEGFSTQAIGLLGAAYYLGFVLGCLYVPALMHRVGHIRAFSGLAALAATVFLVHELTQAVPVWLGLRLIAGVCFAGLYMAVESWLNGRATTATRGRVLAAYLVVGYLAIVAGKLVFAWTDPADFLPFALVSIGVCLAVLPVAFTTGTAPDLVARSRLRVRELYETSPVGLVGCLAVGAANGAFWSMGPIYADLRGLSTMGIGLFISAAVLGGAAAQWPLGKWSDQTDRRKVMVAACVASAVAATALVLNTGADTPATFALAFLFGAGSLPLYGLCVAHANDHAPEESFVEVSGNLLLMFGLGAVAGPYLAALLMTAAGPDGIFLFTAGAHLLLAGFAILRIGRRRPVAEAEKAAFVVLPKTTQAVLPLDPRAETGAEDGPSVGERPGAL